MNCVECGTTTPNLSLICDTCAPLYPDAVQPVSQPYNLPPLVGDECPCPSCRSDMAGLVPCRRV